MNGIIDNEKKRSPNFSYKEKTLLLNILHNFRNIIENKKTNGQTWREKAWSTITELFNSQTLSRIRDLLELLFLKDFMFQKMSSDLIFWKNHHRKCKDLHVIRKFNPLLN